MSDVEQERDPATRDRRSTGDRRRYNRRSSPEVSPPYFETFDRIAAALESIRDELAAMGGRSPGTSAPPAPPRRTEEGR